MILQRTDAFVPLTTQPVSAEKREFRATVISQDKSSAPFESLNPASPTGAAQKKLCEPHLTVHRDGNRITGIRIQCTCGQVMDVACVYEEPSSPA